MGFFSRVAASAAAATAQATWLTLYNSRREQGLTSEEAIRFVIDFLRRREPFDHLSDQTAADFARKFAQLPDPTKFAKFLFEVEKDANRPLLNPGAVTEFVNWHRQQVGWPRI